MVDRARLISAFLLAPMFACLLVGAASGLYFALAFLGGNPSLSDALVRGLGFGALIAIVASGVAIPASLTIGLIVHAVLQKGPWRSQWPYVIAGAIVGLLLPLFANLVWPNSSFFALWGVPIGAFSGYFSWLIRRPDRDAANPPTSAS